MDRESRDPFDLLDELENELGIETYACNWPIGSGKEFQGVYDRRAGQLLFFSGVSGKNRADKLEIDLDDAKVSELIGEKRHAQLKDDVELLGAGREFDMEEVQRGALSPVFFCSALTNFGVELFQEFSPPPPRPPPRGPGPGWPGWPASSPLLGVRFPDYAKRNKPAPLPPPSSARASSSATRNIITCRKQKMRLSQPQQLMASEREIVDEGVRGRHHRRL